jgi:hypothetical protein
MLLWSLLCSFADAKRQMAGWPAQRVRDWDKALMRHEFELAKMMRELIDYCERPAVRAAIGEVSAVRLSAAA